MSDSNKKILMIHRAARMQIVFIEEMELLLRESIEGINLQRVLLHESGPALEENAGNLAGIYLHDPSLLTDELARKVVDFQSKPARIDPQEEARRDRKAADTFTIEGGRAGLSGEDVKEAILDEYEKERREYHRRRKDFWANFFMDTPPSDAGVELIRELRGESSPYRDVPIMVGGAHIGKVPIFRDAGANVVVSSFQYIEAPDIILDFVRSALKGKHQRRLEGRGDTPDEINR